MSIEEGLVSTNVDKIRNARGIAKGRVIRIITNLQNALVVKDGKYLHVNDEIDEEMVQEDYQKLKKTYNNFWNLHYRYEFFRFGDPIA